MSFQQSELSKLQPDLLLMPSGTPLANTDLLPINNPPAFKKDLEAPTHIQSNRNDHELLSAHSRMNVTVANLMDERRTLGGNAFAEHFIRELGTASKINRGPPGTSNSSRLHWDLLLGRDETIEPCDYLNFDYHLKF